MALRPLSDFAPPKRGKERLRVQPPMGLSKVQAMAHAVPYRINMLLGDAFQAALLGEFGFSAKTIAAKLGMTESQVHYRLKKAGVKVTHYRKGANPIGKMVLDGAAKAGVGELRAFTEGQLRHQLEALGWSPSATETPEHPANHEQSQAVANP